MGPVKEGYTKLRWKKCIRDLHIFPILSLIFPKKPFFDEPLSSDSFPNPKLENSGGVSEVCPAKTDTDPEFPGALFSGSIGGKYCNDPLDPGGGATPEES
jgi:hypothetical protein